MNNEVIFWLLVLTIFAFSLGLACGIQSLSQKIDRIEAIINILVRRKEDR